MSAPGQVDPLTINGGNKISTLEELVLALYDIQAVCFGQFELKSGITSPIYIDLRLIVSYPTVLQAVSDEMWSAVSSCRFDVVCGVPYTALPIATILSLQHRRPMVMRRKEAKSYGLKKSIEGVFRPGQTCLVIEDLVTSGLSVFETVQPLNEVGLKVTDVVVLVDREQGGRANLSKSSLQLHSVVSISSMLSILTSAGRIDAATADAVKQFIQKNQVEMTPQTTPVLKTATLATKRASVEDNKGGATCSSSSSSSTATSISSTSPLSVSASPSPSPSTASLSSSNSLPRLTYTARAAHCKNAVGAQLFRLMDEKKTNLCLSIDLTKKEDIINMVEQIGPYICVLKTHVDIVEDFDQDFIKRLVELSVRHNFLLFEDRKFADIGNTAAHQYGRGIYRIAEWAHITNAHALPGPGIISGLRQVGGPAARGLLLLGEMSSQGNLATGAYTHATVAMAETNSDFVFGFISQHKLSPNPGLMYMTPGVQMTEQGTASSGDGLGQQYNTPSHVIGVAESDVIIVGRAIYSSSQPVEQAKRYQKHAWEAYIQRTQ